MNNTHSSRARSTVLPLVLTALFAALTAIGAFLRIPAGEISFTLQVFFTSMAGILLGPWWERPRRWSMFCSASSACPSSRRAAA